ncbi:uncharacterized protein TNCV_2401341 [Trichonephila clavipes]|nr:uncharacterized protein TNCV_2401341 [Trichonephila clavipes]
MLRKRKSDLSKNSSRARAAKVARNEESLARVRSETQAELQAARRAIETPEQSQVRKSHNAEMQSSRRRNFIRKDWSVFNFTGFQYDASIEYHNHPLIVIRSMNKKCQYCDAFKWKDETAGMCCSSDNYKVVIHADRTPRDEHERRYNAPMVNEVAVLVTGEPCSPHET